MATVPPNELISQITDRMPAILEGSDSLMWLGENDASPAEAKATANDACAAFFGRQVQD